MIARPARYGALLLVLITIGVIAGCRSAAGGPRFLVTDAYVREPVSDAPTAGYLDIRNNGGTADRLLSVTTPAARAVQIVQPVTSGGTTQMVRLDGLTIPARSTVRMRPSGAHLMFLEPIGMRRGRSLQLTLHFRRAGAITVEAIVVDPAFVAP